MNDKELARRAALKAAEDWQYHHYRTHSGEFEDCLSKACQAAVDILTRPSNQPYPNLEE